jgi:hypothetical protein
MSFLKIATGLAFGVAGAVFSITAYRRHRRIRRACERCRGTRAESPEQARAFALGAEAPRDAEGAVSATQACAFRGRVRSFSYYN